MRYPITYSETPDQHTVWTATESGDVHDVEAHAQRLRSWAVIMGVKPSGAPFVRFDEGSGATVHLPTAVSPELHHENGLAASESPAATLVGVEGVQFEAAGAVADGLRALFDESDEAAPGFEFIRGAKGFESGTVVLRCAAALAMRPAELAIGEASTTAA